MHLKGVFSDVHTENTEVKGEGMDGYREMTESGWWRQRGGGYRAPASDSQVLAVSVWIVYIPWDPQKQTHTYTRTDSNRDETDAPLDNHLQMANMF